MTYDHEKVNQITASIQQECNRHLEDVINHPHRKEPVDYQDATNVFLFKKLADLEYRVQQLESAAMNNNPLKTI